MEKETACPTLGSKEKKTMKKIIFALIVFVFVLSACGVTPPLVTGSGKMVTQTFDVQGFDQIRLGTSGVLYIEQGNEFRLTIETDDNILPLLSVEVEQGVLTIRTEPATTILQRETLIYRVTLPELSALDLSGSAEIRVENFEAQSLNVNVSGSGDVIFMDLDTNSFSSRISGSGNVTVENLTAQTVFSELNNSGEVRLVGTADSHEIKVSGSGDVFADEFKTSNAQVTVNGSGDINLWVLENLDAIISGSGNVQYFGSPQLTKTISGAGDLTSLGDK